MTGSISLCISRCCVIITVTCLRIKSRRLHDMYQYEIKIPTASIFLQLLCVVLLIIFKDRAIQNNKFAY